MLFITEKWWEYRGIGLLVDWEARRSKPASRRRDDGIAQAGWWSTCMLHVVVRPMMTWQHEKLGKFCMGLSYLGIEDNKIYQQKSGMSA